MICFVMLCCVTLRCVVLCCVMLYYVMLCYVMLCMLNFLFLFITYACDFPCACVCGHACDNTCACSTVAGQNVFFLGGGATWLSET